MSDESFWSRCGVVSIDHYAVTTRDLHATTKDYLDIPGTQLLREPSYNKSQNVDFSFVRLATGETIEILGAKDNSPITEHVSNGGGAYHICFVVDDIDFAIRAYGSNIGQISFDIEQLAPKSWHFIKAINERCIDIFPNLDYYPMASWTARQDSIGKADLIYLYNKYMENTNGCKSRSNINSSTCICLN